MSDAFYYDELAPYYRYLYADWESSCAQQAALLDDIIRDYIGSQAHTILDAACGIGTQCIGLAQRGYAVTATDLSAVAVDKARAEAQRRGVSIAFDVADMRAIDAVVSRTFDVVMACDNAVPHLLSHADILLAFEQFYRHTASGGGCILSVRDYDNLPLGGTQMYPRLTHRTEAGYLAVFDVWVFDGDFYDMTTYLVDDTGGATAQTRIIRGGRYYCVSIATLEQLLRQAGFRDITILRDQFFQPVLIGLKT
jgi:SAM-dependent methyltransferase